MSNRKELLTNELRALYPDFTDIELNGIADCIIDFYTILTEALINNNESGIHISSHFL